MRPAPASTGSALRTWTRHTLPSSASPASQSPRLAAVTASNVPQRRSQTGSASSFESPFGRSKEQHYDTRKIPSFKGYASNSPEITNRVFQYFMAGSMGLLAAAGAKNTVQGT
jgi:ubiquinol-cytochrome c reductase iron-sulfur subunit